MDALTGWDWFVVLVVGVSVLFGFWRGLVHTVFALTAWVTAIIGTPVFGGRLVDALSMQQYPWVVYIVLFLVLFVGVRLLGNLIARGVRAAGLRGADRGLGAVLGVARALIVLTIAAVIAREMGVTASESWQRAMSRPLLEQLAALIDVDFTRPIEQARRSRAGADQAVRI